MPKVTFIGPGSAVFARQLITDILAVDGLDAGSFGLVGIDPTRLELARSTRSTGCSQRWGRWRRKAVGLSLKRPPDRTSERR